jgi:hypothetical protein
MPGLVGRAALGQLWKVISRSQRVSAARLRDAVAWSPAVSDVRVGAKLIVQEWMQSPSGLP